MKRLALSPLLALLLISPAAAWAAPKQNWKGKTEQNSTLYMTVKGGKVTRFSVTLRMFCTNGGGYEYQTLYHDKPLKVRGGKFSFEGEDEAGLDYEFQGRISGSKAKGTAGYHSSNYDPFERSFSFCNAHEIKWTAKRL